MTGYVMAGLTPRPDHGPIFTKAGTCYDCGARILGTDTPEKHAPDCEVALGPEQNCE